MGGEEGDVQFVGNLVGFWAVDSWGRTAGMRVLVCVYLVVRLEGWCYISLEPWFG